jgi:hypothetical protein
MDTLRRLDLRVFRMLACFMKQFWDGAKWVRVTDNDDAPRWVGLNQPMWQDSMTGEVRPEHEWKAAHDAYEAAQAQSPDPLPPPFTELVPALNPDGSPMLQNDVARLDMDILVSDAPDTITLDGETWQAFTELLKQNLPPPALKLAIEMHPALPAKRKKQLMDMVDQMATASPPPGAQRKMQLDLEEQEAGIVATRAKAYRDLTSGESSMAKLGAPAVEPPRPDVAEGFGDQPPPQLGPMGPPPGMPPGMSPGPHPALDAPPPAPQGPPSGPPMAGPMTGASRMVA